MIPIELRVRNFMCYRDDVPPLSFEGIHLACLTGSNGHGKSALLDAITWAVWGKSRAKHDDELIHQGQVEMEVEYTFELGGTVYRILRKRESKKPGRTLLDLQVQHSAGFRSIAGTTIRATQSAIDKLLRMDYDTFTNSAFLLQGKADAFTTRTPAERKQVLADILGLGLYDSYEQRAKDQGRDVERQLDQLDARLKGIDVELARRPEHEAALARAGARVAELSAAVKETEGTLRTLQAELHALERQQVALQGLERRLAQTERELGEIAAKVSERQARLESYEQALAERGEIEQGFAALAAARREEAAWNERLGSARRVESGQRDAERAVAAARQQLELGAGRLGERIRSLENHSGEAARLERDLGEAGARLEYLARRQQERDAARERIQALAEETAGLKATNEQLRAEMQDLREKLDLLEAEVGPGGLPPVRADRSRASTGWSWRKSTWRGARANASNTMPTTRACAPGLPRRRSSRRSSSHWSAISPARPPPRAGMPSSCMRSRRRRRRRPSLRRPRRNMAPCSDGSNRATMHSPSSRSWPAWRPS